MNEKIRSTTILCVRRQGQVALSSDGQVTLGNTVVKSTAKKIRSMADGRVVFDGPVGQRTRETATQSDSNVAKEPHESPLTNAPTGSLTEWVLS